MKELLLLLCMYPYDKTKRENLANLLGDVPDWNELVRLINAHGIMALATYNIKEAGLEKLVPADALAALENGYRQSVVRNIWLKERWKEVNEILEKAGIRHILLKGMALEHTIYGSKGLRQMNDNDILVKHEEAKEAWHLLQKHGFTHNLPKSHLHLKIMRELSHHLPALRKEGYSLELHTHLFDHKTAKELGCPDPFEKAAEITIDNKNAMVLPQDIHLKYLVRHFERHKLSGESQLRLYADILILSPESSVEFAEQFILNPDQKEKTEFRKAAYRAKVKFIDPRYRLLYVIGDLFPSVRWMKERYGCGGIKAVIYYPHRLGKILWLIVG
jgi:hypothetical protein